MEQIFEIIQTLHKAGTTILLVEQNAQAALSAADGATWLETGKIVTTGTGTELSWPPEIKSFIRRGWKSQVCESVCSLLFLQLPGMWYTAAALKGRDPMRGKNGGRPFGSR